MTGVEVPTRKKKKSKRGGMDEETEEKGRSADQASKNRISS